MDKRQTLDTLLQKARELPRQPGVYLMKNTQGVVLYVGKASCLPERVSSYFIPSAELGPRKMPMLQEIADFDIVPCDSEWEALLSENRLIKDLHPRYNIRLTDGKSFPYLVITREDFPAVHITRAPNTYPGARVFGPFVHPTLLREAVAVLQRIFRFRTCDLNISANDNQRKHFRPCLLHPIGQCTAPCADRISQSDYQQDIQRTSRALQGGRRDLIKDLTKDMQQASTNLEFEQAAVLRDQIHALRKLNDRGKAKDGWQPENENLILDPRKSGESLRRALDTKQPIRCIECIDIAHLQGQDTVASVICFVDGRPLKSQYRRYRIRNATNDDFMSMREVISRRYRDAGEGHALYPDLIVIDGGKGQLQSALDIFSHMQIAPPQIVSLAKKEELIYLPNQSQPLKLSRHNQGLRLLQATRDEAHRFAQAYHHTLQRKRLLGQ